MKYPCLIYDDESKRGTIPKDQMHTMMSEYYAFTELIEAMKMRTMTRLPKIGSRRRPSSPAEKRRRATIVRSLPAIEVDTLPGNTRLGLEGNWRAAEMKHAN